MKKVQFTFDKTNPAATNTGLKFVLFEVTTDQNQVIHDWGFCEWEGTHWGGMDIPENFLCVVKWWADTVDPAVLLAEKSKIISLN